MLRTLPPLKVVNMSLGEDTPGISSSLPHIFIVVGLHGILGVGYLLVGELDHELIQLHRQIWLLFALFF